MLIFALIFGHFAKLPSDGLPYQPLRRQRCRRCASDFERLLPTAYFCQSPAREALRVEAEHFVNCIEQNNDH